MNKIIITFALLVIVLAYTEAYSGRCSRACRMNAPSTLTCVRDGKICRKMRHCTLQEVNCRRRLLQRRPLTPASSSLCRNIKNPLGSGRCAVIRRPRSARSSCNRIRCTGRDKKLGCYRSKRNNCRLLTSCQLIRANCRRSQKNSLKPTNPKACAGFKRPGRRQRCRPSNKKG